MDSLSVPRTGLQTITHVLGYYFDYGDIPIYRVQARYIESSRNDPLTSWHGFGMDFDTRSTKSQWITVRPPVKGVRDAVCCRLKLRCSESTTCDWLVSVGTIANNTELKEWRHQGVEEDRNATRSKLSLLDDTSCTTIYRGLYVPSVQSKDPYLSSLFGATAALFIITVEVHP